MGAVFQSLPPLASLSSYPSAEAISTAMRAQEVAKENAVERFGAGELKLLANEAFAVSRDAFNRFMEAPAQTPGGIYLKFEAARSDRL